MFIIENVENRKILKTMKLHNHILKVSNLLSKMFYFLLKIVCF